MPKIGLATIASFILNLFLAGWLVSQYYNDAYFQSYVNTSIGQYYALIVLTIGVGGGSGMGYLFLRRRHSDSSLVSKIQKSKSFRPVQPLSTPSSTVASPRSALPAGAPPAPTSKHTVYAVPPLPKSSTPSGSKSIPSTTWSASSRASIEPFPVQKQETTVRQLIAGQQPSRTEPSRPASIPFSPSPQAQPSSSLRSIGEAPRPTPSWTSQTSASESRSESGPMFQKPGVDIGAKQESSFSRIPSPQIPESSPVPSKWGPPPETKPSTGPFSGTGVRSIPPLPPKWTPPSGGPGPQDRPSSPQSMPRPGQIPPRGPLPPQQGAPRPFVPPGLGRPGAPGPIGAPRTFRPPDPNRPPPSMSPQPRPPMPANRPSPSIGGPMPQPWSPPSELSEKRESANIGDPERASARQSSEPTPSTEPATGGGGEMDWDTALDTILKTLRKDRVGDTK